MKEFPFVWTGPKPLSEELGMPIDSMSVEFFQSWPQWVTLWRPDGTGIKIHSEMVDLAERIEVGVLHFECVESPAANEVFAEIMVVANAFPCNLAIRGVPSITEIFEPEYPLDTYTRVAMS